MPCQRTAPHDSRCDTVKASKIFPITPIPTPPGSAQQRPAEAPEPNLDFKAVLRLVEGDAGGANHSDDLVLTERTEPLMRRLVARYGFDRLPTTYSELYGLFEYCDSLDAASGVGMRPKDQLGEWQAASFVVWRRKNPELMPAIELYCAGDVSGLRSLHRQDDTLTTLGRRYLEAGD